MIVVSQKLQQLYYLENIYFYSNKLSNSNVYTCIYIKCIYYTCILVFKVCKSECSIVTLLLHFYFLALYVTCNVRGTD